MSKIEWAFVFAVRDEPHKDECFFCGSVFTPHPLSIALDAKCVDKEMERILSDRLARCASSASSGHRLKYRHRLVPPAKAWLGPSAQY